MANLHRRYRATVFLFCIVFSYQTNSGFGLKEYGPSSRALVGCIDSQKRALIEFKGSLVEPANRLSSWIGEDCCNWDGITCNNLTGHVEKLHLRNPIYPYIDMYSPDSDNYASYYDNCLGGEINPSIRNLEHLRHLDLSSNNFSGIQIPTFFGSFQNLRYLNLSNAGFSGEVPPHLGNLSNLQYLYLGQYSIYSFSPNFLTSKSLTWITRLPCLKVLDLSQTNLSQSLDWLGSINMLPSLSSLTLQGCELPGNVHLPRSRFNLTSLVLLDIGYNYLTNSASAFTFFNLSSKLEILKISGNDLEGPIPFMLEKFTSLFVLDLSGNSFNSPFVVELLCNQTSLIYLDLSYNQFEGVSLPFCLGNLTSLRELYLKGNKFGGKIPSELGRPQTTNCS